MWWDVLEFIARVTDHIPEPGQQLTRNWGYYANASRGKRRRHSELVSPHDQEGTDPQEQDVDGWRHCRKLTWAKLIQKVYEIDPLLCRFCGTEMKIVSFITKYPVIKKILTHINYESQPPEPLAHSPPLFQDTLVCLRSFLKAETPIRVITERRWSASRHCPAIFFAPSRLRHALVMIQGARARQLSVGLDISKAFPTLFLTPRRIANSYKVATRSVARSLDPPTLPEARAGYRRRSPRRTERGTHRSRLRGRGA